MRTRSSTERTEEPARTRLRVRVGGIVQGVGFRPFVWRLASALGLDGFVCNTAAGVEIEVEGEPSHLGRFLDGLRSEAPRLARVQAVQTEPLPISGKAGFRILESRSGTTATGISPDVAVCDQCLVELFSPGDRRHRYAFINCTQCGPRFTITRRLPYDRPQTSMASFPLCQACHAEYTHPADRRFHAEPNACPACGPQLSLLDRKGRPIVQGDPIAEVLARLRAGEIVAIKGLGGFHLACDATNADVIARLRQRKDREAKPFAVLLANAVSARAFAEVTPAEEALLRSPERPIVLLRKGEEADARLTGVAPGMAWLGVMLPSTPIQFLLFHEEAGRPAGTAWLEDPQALALVMTSANPGGEPLVIGNAEALARLWGIADAFLIHDRDILLRCDDSVARSEGAEAVFVRRARGYAPGGIPLARTGPPVLAVGAALKNTVCLTRGAEAFLSPHVGDLDNLATCRALEETARHLWSILETRPARIAHDLHPDFHSTRFAAELAEELGVPLVGVQHHHAHIAATCAEHGLTHPVIGMALDGMGLGSDGGAWGGELLRVEGARYERVGHLRELLLPGGDRAAREPWRMAAAALHALGRGDEIAERFGAYTEARTLQAVMDRKLCCPPTSSAGRLFDAAAGLLGVREVARFEGEAAMQLEALAISYGEVEPLPGGFAFDGGVLDTCPLLAHLATLPRAQAPRGAALFHATLAAALAEWASRVAREHDIDVIALGGGCFLSRTLSRALRTRLEARGLRVLNAIAAPPNDGGLALGQAWIALQAEG